jgi:phage tail protein X
MIGVKEPSVPGCSILAGVILRSHFWSSSVILGRTFAGSPMINRTRDGDMVDAICMETYDTETMATAVYEANPRLATLGPVLHKGLELILPEQPPTPVLLPLRLWGKST